MVGEANELRRETTLDGLTPRDFDADWPNGRLVEPQRLHDLGLDANQRLNVMASVRLLRELAVDLNIFLQRRETTQELLAPRCRVSANAVRDVQKGNAFPTWNTYGVLRTRVPSAADRAARKHTDRIDALHEELIERDTRAPRDR